MKTTTLKQLAEYLKGNYWEKGDLKRIYLDRGYNTKKMSTKTFVWQDEDGDFQVSCQISCQSQGWQWCKSQEEQVKNSVIKQIEDAVATEYHFAKQKNTESYFAYGKLVDYKEVVQGELYPNKARLLDEIDNCGDDPSEFEFVVISRVQVETDADEAARIEK